MSAQDDGVQSFIAEYSVIVTENYFSYACLSLFLYEYLITLAEEVNLFWKRRWTGATLLFFLNRYAPLLYYLANDTNVFETVVPTTCRTLFKAIIVFDIVVLTTWAAFSALRAYALSRSRALSALVFMLSTVPMGVNATKLWAAEGTVIPAVGCAETDSYSLHTIIGFTTASRSSLIVADCALIAITWATLYRRGGNLHGNSFVYIIVRDGTIYFICLLILNSLHLTFTLLAIATPTPEGISELTIVTDPLTTILVSRFMLNLQAVNNHVVCIGSRSDREGQDSGRVSSLLFNERVLGSLGSSVIDETQAADEEHDDNEEDLETKHEEPPLPVSPPTWDVSEIVTGGTAGVQQELRGSGTGPL
ncbi:hypothetical protein C8Q74DRAFT_1255522 [Fomes fomentarius]|nr:hypothetical protein C8Q74DRAFT_1255522 [Fomes fomentarius]